MRASSLSAGASLHAQLQMQSSVSWQNPCRDGRGNEGLVNPFDHKEDTASGKSGHICDMGQAQGVAGPFQGVFAGLVKSQKRARGTVFVLDNLTSFDAWRRIVPFASVDATCAGRAGLARHRVLQGAIGRDRP